MLKPEIAAALAALPPERTTEPSDLPLEEALAMVRSRPVPPPIADAYTRSEDSVVTQNGLATPVRIYSPASGQNSSRASGIVVNFHGGGWVTGGLDQDDRLCREISRGANCVVISVDYPLAPEHPFPLPLDHCYGVLCWAAENAASLGAPAKFALCGSSAGGNLAAAVSLRARDQNGPKVTAQVLFYPICDCDFDTPSYRANATGFSLSRQRMMWFWDQYLPDASKRTDPLASPLRAKSFAGLPRTFVAVGRQDPLHDDAAFYAEKLKQAGVPVEYMDIDGVIHGFVRTTPDASWTREAMQTAVETITAGLSG